VLFERVDGSFDSVKVARAPEGEGARLRQDAAIMRMLSG